jgi:hypothetical protein
MHGGKCYDIKMMKAERRMNGKKSITSSFARRKDAFLFILFVFQIHPDSGHNTALSALYSLWLDFSFSINKIELNCMHETNKIELKLIEVDARSYLGLELLTIWYSFYLLC